MNLEPLISARAQKTMASEINKEVDKVAKESVKKLFTRPVKSDEVDGDDDDFDFSDSDFDVSNYNDSDDEDEATGHELSTTIDQADQDEPEEVRKILKSIEEKDSFDIFVDIGDYWQKKGQIVRYQINKSNKMLTKVDHPCSWEEIQAKFGGGHYKIIAKLPALNNRYLKSEARVLENAPVTLNGLPVSSRLEAKSEAKDGLSMSELIATLERKTEQAEARAERLRLEADERIARAEEKARREAKERLEEQRMMFDKLTENKGSGVLAELTPLLGIILPKLLEKKEDNTMEMMMKIQEMNQKSIENMQKANERMFTSIQDTIKAMTEQKSSKKDSSDFDALTVMKMIEDAKNAGFEQFKMLEELAEEKAAAREELRGGNEPSGQKDSTIDTLIKSLAPVAAQALMSQQGGVVAPTPVRQPVQVLPSQQPRGVVSQTSSSNRSVGQRVNAERANGVKVQTTQERKTQPNNPNSKEGLGSSERNLLIAPQAPKSFLNADIDEAVNVAQASSTPPNPPTQTLQKDMVNVERIYGVILPIAVTAYTSEGASIAQAAEDSISELTNQGIELTSVIRDFDDETVSAILTSVPDEQIQTLIKGLHNEIIARIKTRIG